MQQCGLFTTRASSDHKQRKKFILFLSFILSFYLKQTGTPRQIHTTTRSRHFNLVVWPSMTDETIHVFVCVFVEPNVLVLSPSLPCVHPNQKSKPLQNDSSENMFLHTQTMQNHFAHIHSPTVKNMIFDRLHISPSAMYSAILEGSKNYLFILV